MNLVKVLIVLAFVVSMAGIGYARELDEVFETAGDTLVGNNGSCPMLLTPYIAKTWKDAANVPLIGKADVRAELSYQCSIDDLTERNEVNLKVGLEY